MNSFVGREWELYDFQNVGGSTEYDNLLINKDIDNYFNDIINKPIIQSNSNISKSNGGLNKFYIDYIEHNLIFIVVLIGIIIFLVIRHYAKDFDTFDADNNKSDNNSYKKILKKTENEKIKSKKIEIEKIKLFNYKKKLDKEKQQILSIIDELSNINDFENNNNYNNNYNNNNNKTYLNLSKQNKDINTLYSNNYNNYNNQTNNLNHQIKLKTKIGTYAHNDTNNNITKYGDDNISNYYDMNKKNDKTNEIDGLYIEPPFM